MDVQKLGVLSLSTSLAFLFAMEDEEVIIMHKRKHRYWMAPYLKARCNPYERNTLPKLEVDFLRVSSIYVNLKLSVCTVAVNN
jgi:hypothetical protein